MASNLDVKLRIDTAVEGLATIEKLVADLQSLLGIAGTKIPDPLRDVTKGANDATKGVDNLEKELKDVGRTKINDPTKPLQDGAKQADKFVKDLVDQIKALGVSGDQLEMLEGFVEGLAEGFLEGAEEAENLLDELDGMDEAGRGVKNVGDNAKKAGDGFGFLGRAAKTALAAIAAYVSFQGLKNLVSTVIDFGSQYEQTMARVRAVTRATDSEFVALGKVARDMGATTEFTARQAADGLAYLGLAGLKANQAIAALPGTLNLAAAAQIDLGRAADITTNILTAMQLEISDLGRVNDVLTRTFTTANTDIEMLGEAFKYAAPKAAAYGYEIEEILGLLGQMANAGLRGSMAGTQLNFAFSKASQVFAKYGESIFTATGETKNLIDAVELLAKQKASPSVINDIFGERGGRAVNALVGMERNDAGMLRRYINDELRKAHEQSATDVIATIQRETVQGAFKIMRSALEEVYVGAFDDMAGSLVDVLRTLTDAITVAQPALMAFVSTLLEFVTIGADVLSFFLNLVNVFNDTSARAIALKTAVAVLTVQGFRILLRVLIETGRTALAARAAILQTAAANAQSAAAANANAAAQGRLAAGFSVVAARAGIATAAARAFSGALALIGGPIGLLVTAIVGLGAAWSEYSRKQEEARDKIRAGIPALKEKQDAVKELIAAWNELAEAEIRSGGVENSKARLAWIDEAIQKAPHLSSEIKKLGADFQAIGDLLKEDEKNIFADRIKNYAENVRVAQEEIDKLNSKALQFDKSADFYDNIGWESRANSLRESAEKFRGDVAKQQELLGAIVSDAARSYAERAVEEGKDLNETISKATVDFMKNINLAEAAGVISPEDLREQIQNFVTQFYNQAAQAAADATLQAQTPLDEEFRAQLSRTEQVIQEFGGRLSASQLLDISKTITGHEEAKAGFQGFLEVLIGEATEASVAIKKQMANMTPDTEQYRKAEAALQEYNAKVQVYNDKLILAKIEADAQYYADLQTQWAEQEKGEKLTAEERSKVYTQFVEEKWRLDAESTRVTKQSAVESQQAIVDMCNNAIAKLNEMGVAATIAGQAVLVALKAQQTAAQVNLDKAREDLDRFTSEQEAQLAAFKKRMAASQKGAGTKKPSGGGGGKSAVVKAAEKENKALEAETKRRAEYEQKIQEEALRAALQRGEIDIKEFMAKKAAMDQASADNEVAVAKAALERIKADRNASQSDIMKAETDLMIAEDEAPKKTQAAYKESFDIIAQEHAILQAKMQQQVDYTNLQIEAGFLSQAQGQRQIKEQVAQTLPILESMVAQYEAMVEECEKLGIVIPGVTDKLLEMKSVNLQNQQVMNQTANEINAVFEGALASALSNVADEFDDLIGLARTFIKTFLDGIAQIAAQKIASSVMSAFDGGGAGGGLGGLLSGILGFAKGGAVDGPGTATSDSILARLSRGEYVINARAVRLLGRGFLDALNGLKSPGQFIQPNIAKFAGGGMVSSTMSSIGQSNPVNAMSASNIGFTVENTWNDKGFITHIFRNPQARRELIRAAGEEKKAFRNVIS